MMQYSYNAYKILLAISAISLLFSLTLFESKRRLFQKNIHPSHPLVDFEEKPLKTILMWNDGYLGSAPFGIAYGGPEVFEKVGCEVTKCLTTTNKSLLANGEKADAIFFNMQGGGEHYFFKDLPQNRNEHQRYIFWANESPMGNNPNPRIHELAGFFNWTMTYRLDSDFVRAYGMVLENEANPPPKGSELQSYIENFGRFNADLVGNRSELKAAWFVSNCNAKSGRQYLVREIQKFMRGFKNILQILNPRILELQHPVIPIVLGGANYSKFVPEHSVINLDDFDSAVEFVNYLKRINDNPNLFAEYFWWKEHYRVNRRQSVAFCDLCKRLHKENEEPKSQWKNISDWWIDQAQCHAKV